MSASKLIASLLLACLLVLVAAAEAKLLRRSRYYDESPYGAESPYAGATGERAILTVRGARSPYDGSAPSKITIEDQPYRGAYPRGVYDRLDGYSQAGRYPMRPLGSAGLYPAPMLRPEPYSGYAAGAPYGG